MAHPPETPSNWTFALYLPVEKRLVACLQSGSVTYESFFHFIYFKRDFDFIPKRRVYDKHKQINICVKVISFIVFLLFLVDFGAITVVSKPV